MSIFGIALEGTDERMKITTAQMIAGYLYFMRDKPGGVILSIRFPLLG